MVEVDARARFYYAFRPKFAVGQLPALLEHVGLALDDVDVVVCNACAGDGLEDPATLARLNRASPEPCAERPPGRRGALVVDFAAVRGTLQDQHVRDVGPAIYRVRNGRYHNDGHACMPGIPDDEVDLLLALLATSQRVEVEKPPSNNHTWWNETDLYGGALPAAA